MQQLDQKYEVLEQSLLVLHQEFPLLQKREEKVIRLTHLNSLFLVVDDVEIVEVIQVSEI